MYENTDLSDMHFIQEYKRYGKYFGYKKFDINIGNHDLAYEYITKDYNKTFGLVNNSNKKDPLAIWGYWVRPQPVEINTISNGEVRTWFLDYEDDDIVDSPDIEERHFNLTNLQLK